MQARLHGGVDDRRLACNQTQAACLGACASCGLPSAVPLIQSAPATFAGPLPRSPSGRSPTGERPDAFRGGRLRYVRAMRLADRIAIVTGAGSGLGRAGALALAREGARVVVSDLDPTRGEETVTALRAEGREGRFVRADVGQPAEAQALVETTVAAYGGLDVLYNNAGVAPIGRDGFTRGDQRSRLGLDPSREPDQRLPAAASTPFRSWPAGPVRRSSIPRRPWPCCRSA